MDQEHRHGGDEDAVRRDDELSHGPPALPHGQADVLAHHSGRLSKLQHDIESNVSLTDSRISM